MFCDVLDEIEIMVVYILFGEIYIDINDVIFGVLKVGLLNVVRYIIFYVFIFLEEIGRMLDLRGGFFY